MGWFCCGARTGPPPLSTSIKTARCPIFELSSSSIRPQRSRPSAPWPPRALSSPLPTAAASAGLAAAEDTLATRPVWSQELETLDLPLQLRCSRVSATATDPLNHVAIGRDTSMSWAHANLLLAVAPSPLILRSPSEIDCGRANSALAPPGALTNRGSAARRRSWLLPSCAAGRFGGR
jgi:hypothetical protein